MKLKLTSLILCAAIALSALSGCSKKDPINTPDGGKATTTGNSGAKGRYVETAYDLPDGSMPLLLNEREDGSVDLYSKKNDDSRELIAYSSKDLTKWDEQNPAWVEAIKKTETGLSYVNEITKEKDGSLLAAITDSKKAVRIYRITNDIPTEIQMPSWDLPTKEGSGSISIGGGSVNIGTAAEATTEASGEKKATPTMRETMYVGQLIALENGNFIVRQGYGSMILHDGKTGAELKNYGESYTDITALGNKIYRLNQERNGIEVLDIETGNVDTTLPLAVKGETVNLFAGTDNAIYIASKSGVSRMVAGGSVWETIIDGGLSALSIPSLYLNSVAVGKDRSFYMIFMHGEGQSKLYKAVYDPNASAVPDTEITVYSLYENSTIRQAIGEFQQANPTIMVNYRIGMDDESSATVSDVVRALNTEILADKAPDILILDDLPSQSYIEKGVLTDLTDFYTELSKNTKLIEPVASSYKKDDKLYAIPSRFKVPMLLGEKDLLDKLNSLSDFNSDYGSKSPLMVTGEISNFLDAIIPTSYSSWFKEDGSLDSDKLTEFLTDVNNIYSKYKPVVDSSGMTAASLSFSISGGSGSVGFDSGDMSFMTGKVQTSLTNAGNGYFVASLIKGMSFTMEGSAASDEKRNTTVKLAPGQTEGAYTPTVVAGITQNSKQQDIAKSFLKTLLSESVQNCAFDDGFAVNEKSFDFNNKTVAKNENDIPKELSEVKALLSQLKTPAFIDSVLLGAVYTNATAMLEGKKDVDTAIKDILSKVEIYLAE